MELNELQNIWLQYDQKMADNTRLNKEILKRMLMSKPEKRLNWIKIKAGFNLFSPVILIFLIKTMDMKFSLTTNFYIGSSLFFIIFLIGYIWDIRYFFLILKIDFSSSILSIKKQIAELEKYKIRTTKIRFLIMPFAFLGLFIIIPQKPIFNFESIIPFALIILVYISSVYYTFKYAIFEKFRKLNKEISEISELEKE